MSDKEREPIGEEELSEEEVEEIASMVRNKIYRDHTRAVIVQHGFDVGLLCGLIRDPSLTDAMKNNVSFLNALMGAWMDSAPEPTDLVEQLCDSFVSAKLRESGFEAQDFEEEDEKETGE